jgi:hypothetical protein
LFNACFITHLYLNEDSTTVHVNRSRLYDLTILLGGKIKQKPKLSLYRPWRPLGLREVEAPTFSDIRLTDGGKVVSPTHRPLFTPRKISGTHFC